MYDDTNLRELREVTASLLCTRRGWQIQWSCARDRSTHSLPLTSDALAWRSWETPLRVMLQIMFDDWRTPSNWPWSYRTVTPWGVFSISFAFCSAEELLRVTAPSRAIGTIWHLYRVNDSPECWAFVSREPSVRDGRVDYPRFVDDYV